MIGGSEERVWVWIGHPALGGPPPAERVAMGMNGTCRVAPWLRLGRRWNPRPIGCVFFLRGPPARCSEDRLELRRKCSQA